MIPQAKNQWLLLGLMVLIVAIAVDYGVFVYRQRHGDVLSYVTVREYVPIAGRGGNYSYDYFGTVDVSCVETMLPHQRMTPCWWVMLHRFHWQ